MKMIKMQNHCRGCQNRYVGCHSECEIYKADKEKHIEKCSTIFDNATDDRVWHKYLSGKKKRTFR